LAVPLANQFDQLIETDSQMPGLKDQFVDRRTDHTTPLGRRESLREFGDKRSGGAAFLDQPLVL
jgi:hypothetical protein